MGTRSIVAGVAGTGFVGALALTVLRSKTAVHTAEEESRDELQHHVSNMLSLTRDLLAMVRKQFYSSDVARYSDAHAFVRQVQDTLEVHAEDLARELESLGGDTTSSLKSIVATTTGAAGALLGRMRSKQVSRMLRDDYAVLSLACISYTMLHTTALSLHSERVAELAQRHLRDLARLVLRLGEEMPRVVVTELARESLPVDVNVGQRAAEDAQRAWTASAAEVHG